MGTKKHLDLVATDGIRAVRPVKLSISGDSASLYRYEGDTVRETKRCVRLSVGGEVW